MAQTAPGQQLNDLLITRNFEPQALDASGKPAPSPDQATVFSFDYTGESGTDYGTVVIMLGENNDMSVFFGDNVGKSMEGDDKKEWFDFLYQLRQFAKRNLLSFSLQNLNKLKYSMQGQAAIKEGIFESWQGNKTNSWNGAETDARLMIKHKKNIKEGDARFRYIDALFIETAEGERYKLPFNSLTAGRAMLEHVKQGGRPYDTRGQHIVTIVNEMSLLSRFKRANQGKIFEGETAQLVVEAMEYHNTLQHTLKSLSTKTGYKKYFESWNPADITDEDVIIEDLRHMFIEQNIDSRIEQALPLLARLKQETAMKEINVFEGWMNLLSEGTWALPDTPEKQQQLITLLADELPVGPDATNATEQLYNLLGDDDLFDQLHDLAREDANADARTVIINKLEQMKSNPAVAQVIGKLKIEQTPQPQEPVQEGESCQVCHESTCSGDHEQIKEGHEECRYCGGNCPNDEDHACDGYLGDIDNLYADEESKTVDESIQRLAELSGLEEASDTVKFGKDGKPVAWSHEGDWEKVPKRNGKPVDPRGEVTNMVGKELNKAKQIANLEEDEGSPVESAIINRIMRAHPDLLQQFGPEAIMNAAREEAEWVGDVDEIGSSDVSAWVNNIIRNLGGEQVNELSNDTVKNYKEKAWDEFARGNDKRGAGLGRAIAKQRGEFGHVKPTDEQLDELSPNTLKSYIKKAGSSSHKNSASNLASRAADKLAQAHNPGVEDDGYDDDHKSYMRSKGIARAVDRLEEGGMSEADLLLQEIARGNVDIRDIYANPKSNVEKFVSNQLQQKAEEAAREQNLDLNDDIDDILQRIQRELEVEYGTDDNMDIEMETVGGGNWLEEGNQVYDPITKKMVAKKSAKVKMGGGWRNTDPETGRVKDSSDPSEIGKHKDELDESTALTGQYGHSGRLQAVKPQDDDMMARIKFLAGLTK